MNRELIIKDFVIRGVQPRVFIFDRFFFANLLVKFFVFVRPICRLNFADPNLSLFFKYTLLNRTVECNFEVLVRESGQCFVHVVLFAVVD